MLQPLIDNTFPQYVALGQVQLVLRKAQSSEKFGSKLRWEYYSPRYSFAISAKKVKADTYVSISFIPELAQLNNETLTLSTEKEFRSYNEYYL